MTAALLVGPGLPEFEQHGMDVWSDDANARTLFDGFDREHSGNLRVAIPSDSHPKRLISRPFRPEHLGGITDVTDTVIEEGLRALQNPQSPWKKTEEGTLALIVSDQGLRRRYSGTIFVEPTCGTKERTSPAVSLTRYLEPRRGGHSLQPPLRSITFEGPSPHREAETLPFDLWFSHRISVDEEFGAEQGLPLGLSLFHRRIELSFGNNPAEAFMLGMRSYYRGHFSRIWPLLGFESPAPATQEIVLSILERFFNSGLIGRQSPDEAEFLVGNKEHPKDLDRFTSTPPGKMEYQQIRATSRRKSGTVILNLRRASPQVNGDLDSLEIRIRLTPQDLARLDYHPLTKTRWENLNGPQ